MRKKGQLAIVVIILFIIVTILFISAIVAPFGVLFTTATYEASENLLNLSEDISDNIADPVIKQNIVDNINQAKANTQDNIDVFTGLYKYGWVMLTFIIGLVAFLWTRRAVETGGLV